VWVLIWNCASDDQERYWVWGFGVVQFCSCVLRRNSVLQLEDLPPENAGSRFCRNSVTCSLSHTTSHPTEQKSCFICLPKASHSYVSGPQWTALKFALVFSPQRILSKEPVFHALEGYKSCWPSCVLGFNTRGRITFEPCHACCMLSSE